MKRQVEMEETMLRAHRDFLGHLEKSINILAQDIDEAGEMAHICTNEWCLATESVLDELAAKGFLSEQRRWLAGDVNIGPAT